MRTSKEIFNESNKDTKRWDNIKTWKPSGPGKMTATKDANWVRKKDYDDLHQYWRFDQGRLDRAGSHIRTIIKRFEGLKNKLTPDDYKLIKQEVIDMINKIRIKD